MQTFAIENLQLPAVVFDEVRLLQKPRCEVHALPANSEETGMNPLLALLTHRPFPELAEAIRLKVDQIAISWDAAVRKAMPQMQRLTVEELRDSTPQILLAIADALASDDPNLIGELIDRAPAQGL